MPHFGRRGGASDCQPLKYGLDRTDPLALN